MKIQLNDRAVVTVWYIAMCNRCMGAQPFLSPESRGEWAVTHRAATEHDIHSYIELWIDEGERPVMRIRE